jgi:hypothetical protein
MHIYLRRTAAIVMVLSILAGSLAAHAQELTAIPPPLPPDQEAPPPNAAPQGAVSQAPSYSQGQIDQLLAPIALYPDQLVGQILMASTYPLEVVEAQRWLQDPNNAALKGDDLANAMEQQPWDPSVKSLTAFPQVLNMMNGNLQWTEQLGDAFLAQQPAVTAEVQHLRQQAQATGNLKSTPQQTVETQGTAIAIEPAQPQVVYVPVYNPSVVYGSWAYPAYPPYYFPSYYYPGAVFVGGGLIGFGIGVAVIDPLWGWWRWDWHHHHIDIDDHRFAELNHGRAGFRGGVWQHDPDHRRGVPYRNAATSARFLGASANSPAARRTFRGFPAAANRTASFNTSHAAFRNTAVPAARPNFTNNHAQSFNGRPTTPVQQHTMQRPMTQRPVTQQIQRPTPMQPQTRAAPMQRPTFIQQRSFTQQRQAPMYESFARGQDVHAQQARGAYSRASEQSFHAQSPAARAAPAARSSGDRSSAPRSRGGGDGGGRGGNSNNFHQH